MTTRTNRPDPSTRFQARATKFYRGYALTTMTDGCVEVRDRDDILCWTALDWAEAQDLIEEEIAEAQERHAYDD